MKLHYFKQPKPDEDDFWSAAFRYLGVVPETCLLGGQLLCHSYHRTTEVSPCVTCLGPRERCHGLPLQTEEERAQLGEQVRLKDLFLGGVSLPDFIHPEDPTA